MKKLVKQIFVLGLLLSGGCSDELIEKGNRNIALGDYQRAILLFSKEVDRNPESFDARIGLGKALLQQLSAVKNSGDEQWNACLTNLEAARTIKPAEDVSRILSAAWNQRASVLLRRADSSQALDALGRSIQYDRTNTKALNMAGMLYFNKGETEKAFSFFSLVMRLDTSSVTGAFNSGIVAWSKGDCRTARHIWLSALEKFPQDRELLYWTALSEKTCGEAE